MSMRGRSWPPHPQLLEILQPPVHKYNRSHKDTRWYQNYILIIHVEKHQNGLAHHLFHLTGKCISGFQLILWATLAKPTVTECLLTSPQGSPASASAQTPLAVQLTAPPGSSHSPSSWFSIPELAAAVIALELYSWKSWPRHRGWKKLPWSRVRFSAPLIRCTWVLN